MSENWKNTLKLSLILKEKNLITFNFFFNSKDVKLPVRLQRVMAAEAEAARDARAKVGKLYL